MRHFGKRAFALLLALILCLSLFPSALAEDAGHIAAAEDAPEQEGTIAPAEEGSIRPAEEGDALPRTDETQDGETSGQCGDDLNWSFDGYGTLTIMGSGDMWNWSKLESAWPSTPWQATVSRITSIRIASGVTSIGEYAFYGCQNMTDISIAETVTRIGEGAFDSCNIIPSMTIPEGVTSIGTAAFSSCHGLKSIWLPASLSQVGEDLFSSCYALKDVYYGGTMAEWESLGAAYDYSKVVVHCADGDLSPTDPTQCGDNLTWSFDESTGTLIITGSGEMWNWGFDEAPWYGLKNEIRALLLPEGLTRIGQLAFEMLRSLSSVEIPAGVREIGYGSFMYCTNLRSVTIPDTVETIDAYAFSQCGIESLIIPEGVSTLEVDAFSNCSSLKTVSLPTSLSDVSNRAF